MNAYYIQDRLEAQSWTRHYQQIAREEKEAELADDMEKGLPQHLFESLCIDHLQRHGASKKAITRAFDDDVEFQERMAEHIRYMVETHRTAISGRGWKKPLSSAYNSDRR
ncbi:host-nuclease inhibitor Gam family protein [Escherichia coli]|uniref:host-nuclease inhibitor Gam family protein n=19 Tax=Enterobacteriaceae TaxID=543 RepID=UPI00208DC449|nr:host-nuclease inhibitor Gam family protein [Escherichia coli]MDA6546670.1 host-nuclease inhibitor Gam family protein [Escherichia coli]